MFTCLDTYKYTIYILYSLLLYLHKCKKMYLIERRVCLFYLLLMLYKVITGGSLLCVLDN